MVTLCTFTYMLLNVYVVMYFITYDTFSFYIFIIDRSLASLYYMSALINPLISLYLHTETLSVNHLNAKKWAICSLIPQTNANENLTS